MSSAASLLLYGSALLLAQDPDAPVFLPYDPPPPAPAPEPPPPPPTPPTPPPAPPPPAAPVELTTELAPVPWDSLVPLGRSRAWGLLVLWDPAMADGPARAAALGAALERALRAQPAVRSVRLYPDTQRLLDQPDEEIALTVSADLDVTRVLLARVHPGGPDGALPTATLRALDGDARPLAHAPGLPLFVVPAPVPPPAPPPPPPTAAPRRTRRWEPPPPAPYAATPDAALAEFKRRALVVDLLPPEHPEDLPEVVVLRNGKVLTDAQLDRLGAPAPPLPPANLEGLTVLRRASAGVGLAGVCVVPLATGTVGLLGAAGLCSALAVASSAGGNADQLLQNLIVFNYIGALCFYPPVVVVLGVVGAAVGAVVSMLSGSSFLWDLVNREEETPTSVHPYLGFVTRYNKALARKLKVNPAKVGRKYFPTGRPPTRR